MKTRWLLAVLGALAFVVLLTWLPIRWPAGVAPGAGRGGGRRRHRRKRLVRRRRASRPTWISRSRTWTARTSSSPRSRARWSCSTSGRRGAGRAWMEIPWFVELQEQYRDKGFGDRRHLGRRPDREAEAVRGGVQDELPGARRAPDRDDVQDAFGPIFGIPISVIISRDGKICKQVIGGVEQGSSSRGRSRRCCSMIPTRGSVQRMLKGFTHARLACGCRIGVPRRRRGEPGDGRRRRRRRPACVCRCTSATCRCSITAKPCARRRACCPPKEGEFEEEG